MSKTRHSRSAALLAASAILAMGLAGCGSTSSATGGDDNTSAAGSQPSVGTAGGSGATADGASTVGCSIVTPAELSQAAGVTYTAIDTGSHCGVTGASQADSFTFTIGSASDPSNPWDNVVKFTKDNDGSAPPISGVGDKAVGNAQEFAAQAHGYVVWINWGGGIDHPKDGLARNKAIASLIIGKLP